MMKTLSFYTPERLSALLLLAMVSLYLHPAPVHAQPNAGGISMEEAMEEANALLRAHGIDPDGSGHGHDHEPAPSGMSASPPTPASAQETFTPLTLDEIRNNPDVWPAKIVMLERVDFHGGLRLTPGNQVDFSGFADDGENIYLDYGEYNLTLPVGITDLEERANDVARGQAKAEGFRGRLMEQLDQRIVTLDGNQMRRSSTANIEAADLFLFYMSSDACGWCRQFTPKLVRAVEQVEARYPGRLKVIHASVDRNQNEFRSKYQKIGADAAIPPGDRWFINAYSVLHPGISQITQPSLMLFNVNGRMIDSGGRLGRDTGAINSVLARLPENVANAENLSPAWTRLDTPIPLGGTSVAMGAVDPVKFEMSTDSSVSGPEPYPATAPDGSPIPGLVLYDNTASGSRIPALTLQKFPADNGSGHYYVLSFRQVLGQTVGGGRPLLTGWLKSTTRAGSHAEIDLAARAADFRALQEKYLRWKNTAMQNAVSDFSKSIYTLPQTIVDSRFLRSAIAIPGQNNAPDPHLDILFVVSGKPQNATLKTETITWMQADMDAFTRLVPQIDLLVGQLDKEERRLGLERRQQVEELQNVDSLFQ